MVEVEIATNGYVVRGRSAEGQELIAIAKHYEEVSHYVSHFLYAEGEVNHKIPNHKESAPIEKEEVQA